MAKERLAEKVATHPIGFKLLSEKFTLAQLQNLYEAIYETSVDKRNFLRKTLSLGILIRLNEKEKLFQRKEVFYTGSIFEMYKRLEKKGVQFVNYRL